VDDGFNKCRQIRGYCRPTLVNRVGKLLSIRKPIMPSNTANNARMNRPTTSSRLLFDRRVLMPLVMCVWALSTSVAAAAQTLPVVQSKPGQTLSSLLGDKPIGDYYELPTAGGLIAFELDGKFYVMSKNGRFLFDGTLRDIWNEGATLDSMADIKRYALRLDLEALGLDFSQLVMARFGDGNRTATIFVTPDCTLCAGAIQAVESLPEQYRVRVVVIPGQGTVDATRAIDCAETAHGRRAAVAALYDGKRQTPAVAEGCDQPMAHLTNTLMAARVMGIDRVPFIVAPDGRISRGLPRNNTLAGFFAGTEIAP